MSPAKNRREILRVICSIGTPTIVADSKSRELERCEISSLVVTEAAWMWAYFDLRCRLAFSCHCDEVEVLLAVSLSLDLSAV